jgi:hypothetical protein
VEKEIELEKRIGVRHISLGGKYMAVTFYMGNDMEDAATTSNFVEFDEELQNLFCKKSEKLRPQIDLLIGLDPYGDKEFDANGIQQIVEICDMISNIYNDREVQEFVSELKRLCKEALNKDFKVYALGD